MRFTESHLMRSLKQVTKSIQIDSAIDFSACKFVWIAALYLHLYSWLYECKSSFLLSLLFYFLPCSPLQMHCLPLSWSLSSLFVLFFPSLFFPLPSAAFCQSRNVFISHSFLISAWFPLLLFSVCVWYRAAGGYKTCTQRIKVLVRFVSTYKFTFGCIYQRRNCKWDK